MDRVIDQAIRECATTNQTSSVNQVLTRVFGANHADMTLFFVDLFSTKDASFSDGDSTLTIHYHQKSFRSVFLKHARLLGLEEDPEEHEDVDTPAVKTTELSSNKANTHRGRKRRYTTFVSSSSTNNDAAFQVKFLLRSGPLVITRRYHTLISIRLVCATLMDPSWHNTCQSLSDIPYLLAWLLLRFKHNPAPRSFVVQALLTEQARADIFVQYQIQNPTELFSQRLEMIFAEKAADTLSSRKQLREKLQDAFSQQSDQEKADEILKGSGPLDPDLLTLTTYIYFRYRMSDLQMSHERVKPMFALLMCVFEELARSTNAELVGEDDAGAFLHTHVESAVDVMTSATKIQAANDIRAESRVYRRLLDIASEIHLFMKRRARGTEIIAHGGNMQELDQMMVVRVSLIQNIYCSMGRIERRLNELKLLEGMRESYDLMSERKLFYWAKVMQVPWKGLVQELSRRLASFQAQSLMAYAAKYPECVVFVTEDRVRAHQVLATVRYLNRKYPSFRMQVMGFRSVSNSPSRPVDVEIENSEDLLRPEGDAGEEESIIKSLLNRNDSMAVIHDGSLCVVCFSSPKAHQRMCAYELLETLTTFGHEKAVPFYTHVLRLYSGVFNRVRERDERREPDDDKENLWIAVQILVYHLCRYSPHRYKRMIMSVNRCVLHRGHLLFDIYRWLHWICERLAAYMQKYPFFRVFGEAEAAASYKEQHQALANTCDIILCFLCLNTMHLVPGGVLERVRLYLDKLQTDEDPRFNGHRDLYIYLCHLKKTLKVLPDAPQLEKTENRFVALQFYVRELVQDEIYKKSKLFQELLFDEAYQHRDKERRVWINVLVYKFCVDRSIDLEVAGEVLFKMNYEIEKVDRRIYWRQTRAEGKDRDVVSTGARTPKTPSTPNHGLSAPNTPQQESSRPGTPRPGTPRPGTPVSVHGLNQPNYTKVFRRETDNYGGWSDIANLPDEKKALENYELLLRSQGQDLDHEPRAEPHISAKHMILRQIDRETKAGFGWVERDRSNWRNPPHPFSESSKRWLFSGLNRIFSETPLFMASVEYSHFFTWPRIKPGPDEVQHIGYERIKHVNPPGPIYYLMGDEITEAKLSERRCKVGEWQFQTVGIQDADKIEPLAVMMRELEWMLHYRSYTESAHVAAHYRAVNASPCVWTLRSEDFVRKQLNSRLPVEYRMYKPENAVSHDQQVGEFLCLEDALWILQKESHDQETVPPAAAAAASSSVTTSSTPPVVPDIPAPSDAELRHICKEHSKTFSGTLANIGMKADSIEELPLVMFIRSSVLPEPEPKDQAQDEMDELLQEGLMQNFYSDSNYPKIAPRPAKKRPPQEATSSTTPAPLPPSHHSLYSNARPPPSAPVGVEGYDDLGFEIEQYGSHSWVHEMSGYYNNTTAASATTSTTGPSAASVPPDN